MKRLIILLFFQAVILLQFSLQAQYDSIPEEKRDLPSFMYYDPIRQMDVEYKLPSGFKHKYNDVFTGAMFWVGLDGIVESDDDELFILFYVPYFHTKKDSVELSMFSNPENRLRLSPNLMHRNTVRVDINNISYYKQTPPDVGKELTYYSFEKSREYFNADSAIIYNINIKDHPYNYTLPESDPRIFDLDKHKYCRVVMLQKKDRSFLSMYCFYSDKAATKIDDYIDSLKGIFWFREQ